jgi:hypothetical protein
LKRLLRYLPLAFLPFILLFFLMLPGSELVFSVPGLDPEAVPAAHPTAVPGPEATTLPADDPAAVPSLVPGAEPCAVQSGDTGDVLGCRLIDFFVKSIRGITVGLKVVPSDSIDNVKQKIQVSLNSI